MIFSLLVVDRKLLFLFLLFFLITMIVARRFLANTSYLFTVFPLHEVVNKALLKSFH